MLPCYVIGESGTLGRDFLCYQQITSLTAVWEPELIEDLQHSTPVATGVSVRPFATNFYQAFSMLEILVVMAVFAIGMAKAKPRRRRSMGRYLRGNVDESIPLGTLASRTLVLTAFDETVVERTFISSVVATWRLADMTQGAGIGPIMVGLAHSDYSAAEIEEWIETTGSWNEGDLVQTREVARRLIKTVGVFGDADVDGVGIAHLRNGNPITTKLKWILTTGDTVDAWAYNLGGNPLATTTPTVFLQGHANLWPRG